MFPDIGGGLAEAVFIAVLALIVVGPRDLPKVLYTLGKWTGKAQALASEFRAGLRAIAHAEEVKQQPPVEREENIESRISAGTDTPTKYPVNRG